MIRCLLDSVPQAELAAVEELHREAEQDLHQHEGERLRAVKELQELQLRYQEEVREGRVLDARHSLDYLCAGLLPPPLHSCVSRLHRSGCRPRPPDRR